MKSIILYYLYYITYIIYIYFKNCTFSKMPKIYSKSKLFSKIRVSSFYSINYDIWKERYIKFYVLK